MPDVKPAPVIQSTDQEPPVRPTQGWTLSKIASAKRLADAGDYSGAAALWDAVMSDERALGPLQALCGIASLPVEFESDNPDLAAEQDPRCVALERDWWRIFPDHVQSEIIRLSAGLGAAVAQIVGWYRDTKTNRLVPQLEVWATQHLKWSDDKGWLIRTRQATNGKPLELGKEFLLFTPYGRKRPWVKAPWYGLGLLWFAAQCGKLAHAEWNDTHAIPHKAADNQRAGTDGFGLVDEVGQRKLLSNLQELVRGGSIVLPDGYRLQLLETTSQNWLSFVKLCHEIWPMAVAIALTGNNLTTQVEGGSFAAAKEATGVSTDRKKTFASSMESTSHDQLLTQWSVLNFGDGDAPWPHYVVSSTDPDAEADRLQKVGAAVQAFTAAGIPLVGKELRERYGVPVDLEALGDKPPAQLFAYHLDYGIVSKNEVRETLGREPVPDGDKPATPIANQPTSSDPARALERYLEARGVTEHRANKGLENGQEFIDILGGEAIEAAQKALRPTLEKLQELVENAPSYSALRRAIPELYGHLDSSAYAEVVERAEQLAVMGGRLSATEETVG